MLRFSEFLKEYANIPVLPPHLQQHPNIQGGTLLGIAVEPHEQDDYQATIAAHADDPNTPEVETLDGPVTWQTANMAGSNAQKKALNQMRAQAGL